ncbi:MAG TPA: 30S ribosomal protein S20 [Candidatus Sumerlaeota bacterium]|nr:MAG: 30S ribosomal protein S20 [candidate division BRC1 bacterium ADurb.BinA292]HOE96709.1 30S ribosomal protein S20 [Candidatus Sumerlaeota bacterium]HOR27687.1 30S ribosomal protein S20 [Candidatus Sumerlaeota bacterium]HPK03556.1 30S ribosomal protein S20 [Candidatus Sumerlaeota bacterium]
MPNIKSAAKRMRQNIKRRAQNRSERSALRTGIKNLRAVIEQGDVETARKDLQSTLSLIGKSASKGTIHPNKARRQASRLTRKVNQMKASEG